MVVPTSCFSFFNLPNVKIVGLSKGHFQPYEVAQLPQDYFIACIVPIILQSKNISPCSWVLQDSFHASEIYAQTDNSHTFSSEVATSLQQFTLGTFSKGSLEIMNTLKKTSTKARNVERHSEHIHTFLQTDFWGPHQSQNPGLIDKGIDLTQWFLHCYDQPSLTFFSKKPKSLSLIASSMIVLSPPLTLKAFLIFRERLTQ